MPRAATGRSWQGRPDQTHTRRHHITHRLRAKLGKLDLHHQLAGLQDRQRGQRRVKDIEASHHGTHVHVKRNAHGALIHHPRLALVVHDGPRAHHVADALDVELAAERIGAPQQKVIVASQNLLKLAARKWRVLLVDPAAVLLFALELNHLIAAVIDLEQTNTQTPLNRLIQNVVKSLRPIRNKE